LIRETGPEHAPSDPPRGPLGTRSGDKGADANIGVWARHAADYPALVGWLTCEKLAELLPEAAAHPIERYEMRNLWAVNFVIRGLLAHRDPLDPQGKALGERLRARIRVALGEPLVTTEGSNDVARQMGV
jgi:hypothetical protein